MIYIFLMENPDDVVDRPNEKRYDKITVEENMPMPVEKSKRIICKCTDER